MEPKSPSQSDAGNEQKQPVRPGEATYKTLIIVGLIVGFVVLVHTLPGVRVFRVNVAAEPGWENFQSEYRISHFGDDGQFVRAVQNGYNLVYHTYKYAPRFTRKDANASANACVSCHSVQDLAYAFVNADRFDPKLGKRMSFEDSVRRCYAGSMNGFVPTIYDPAVRDIRLLARAVAHHLQLGEGAIKTGG